MTSGPYKIDDGQSCPTNCFPAGALQQRRKEGAGHWLVAYRKAEEQRYRNVQRRIKDTYRKCENTLADSPHGVTLGRVFLLQLHCVDEPLELCSVDISERELNSVQVEAEDLKVFDNVAYIDASINSLSLGSFSSFVSLRELNLSLNGICNMTFDAADFPHLEVLDLSYNSLSADGIVSLGRLPHLKVLHLTGNKLHRLPPNLGSSNRDRTQMPAEDENTQFKTLEVLMLDDNKLSSGVFNSLTNLKRLKHLNLQKNRISEIPFMQLVGCSKPEQISTEEEAEEAGRDHAESNPNTDMSQSLPKDSCEEHCNGSSLPLPELQYLNLADNKVCEEEALMAAALFPKLREIDIHSNPLTTQRRGDPPLLTYYLQERLGITIKRKKTQEAVKLPVKVFTDVKWKMEGKIPKVSNKPLLMTTAHPAQSQAEKSQATVKRTTGSEGKTGGGLTFPENSEHFFITQAADVPEFKFDLPPEEKETPQEEERNNPQQFSCNKLLMATKPNPDALKPAGIQSTVRMLEHTLKNLNIYRDSKPKLDSIQTPYREREKRIKELPPLKPMKQPTERVDEMIKSIKDSTTVKVVTLGSAMQSTDVNRGEYKEALSLLTDMKTKYKMVHKKTMEQVGSGEHDGNIDQNKAEPPPGQTL